MRTLALLFPLIAITIMKEDITCGCLNGGTCPHPAKTTCQCLKGFLGSDCHLSASKLSQEAIHARLERRYKYFYFEPSQVNYYRLSLTVCMKRNPSKRGTLFYIETESSDGALRKTPSIFETSQIILKEQECRKFSTHYISVKQKDDESLRRIVVGLKVTQDGDAFNLNSFLQKNEGRPNQSQTILNVSASKQEGEFIQQITIKATAQIYLQTNKFGSLLFLFTAFVLIILVKTFITHQRRRFALDTLEVELDALHLQSRELARIRRQLGTINPEDTRPRTKNNLNNMEIFMPVTHYGTPQSIFIPHLLSNLQLTPKSTEQQIQSCSICLIDFDIGDQIRTTPCSHKYHRQCIDNWCESRLSCPICRRDLDFSREVRRLYYDLLRNQLAM